jgi:enamine deaminase RidA (YjgF/YER057c/UK114 family)
VVGSYENVGLALASAGATWADVAKVTTFLVHRRNGLIRASRRDVGERSERSRRADLIRRHDH